MITGQWFSNQIGSQLCWYQVMKGAFFYTYRLLGTGQSVVSMLSCKECTRLA